MLPDGLIFLLADDDSDDCEIFQEGLQETAPPHTLHWVKHGEKILPAVKETNPDILFLDLNLPGGSTGMDCLRVMKEDVALRSIPVVIYTTSNATEDIKGCYSLGASRYLLKPVTYSGIFKGLNLILEIYQEGKLTTPGFDQFVIDTYKLK
jgi:CheY-like chemotaxis protein